MMTILRGFVPFIATALSLTFLKAAGRFLIGSEQTRKVAPFCKQIGQSIGIKNTQESAQRLAQNPGQAAGGGNDAIVTVEKIKAVFGMARSEEHTSELQSLMRKSYAGFCLKKKKTQNERKI